MKFNIKIKEMRTKKGITQSELAEKLGIHQVNISNYEKNIRTPNLERLLQIAKELDVSLDQLIDYEVSHRLYSNEMASVIWGDDLYKYVLTPIKYKDHLGYIFVYGDDIYKAIKLLERTSEKEFLNNLNLDNIINKYEEFCVKKLNDFGIRSFIVENWMNDPIELLKKESEEN